MKSKIKKIDKVIINWMKTELGVTDEEFDGANIMVNEIGYNEIRVSFKNDNIIDEDMDKGKWLFLKDEEATKLAIESTKSFLDDQLFWESNSPFLTMLKERDIIDTRELAEQLVEEDGRGDALARYDNVEHEINDGWFGYQVG
jgi:hypothetical protein